MMNRGICCAGSMIVDITYPIEAWPKQGELTHIMEGIRTSAGGCVCNTITDLARLDPSLHLTASGFAGHDPEGGFLLEELGRYPNIDLGMVRRDGRTSFTAVMSNRQTMERTFFQHAGANARYGEDEIDWDRLNADILHVGYLLLLPHLDEPDEIYGTKMARLLCHARERGLRTSIDVVTEAGNRFATVVPPALKYTDYCIINELEAQQITGVPLRTGEGGLLRKNLPPALERLRSLGVSAWAAIHCPELGCGLDAGGNYYEQPSLQLPKGFIRGAVGAGDAFCAGMLYGAYSGWTMPEALRLAVCTAAASLRQAGASGGVGTVNEMLALGKQYL